MNDAGQNNSWFLKSCLYTDANNIQEYLTLKLVFAVINHKQNIVSNKNSNLPILIYKNNRYYILLNNWENLNYFILAFAILFSLSNSDHFV